MYTKLKWCLYHVYTFLQVQGHWWILRVQALGRRVSNLRLVFSTQTLSLTINGRERLYCIYLSTTRHRTGNLMEELRVRVKASKAPPYRLSSMQGFWGITLPLGGHMASFITEPLSLGSGTSLWTCCLWWNIWPGNHVWMAAIKCKAWRGPCGVPASHPLSWIPRLSSPGSSEGRETGDGLQQGSTLFSLTSAVSLQLRNFSFVQKQREREGFHLPRILLITYERVSSSTDSKMSLKWVSKTPRPINLNCFNTSRRIKGTF